MSNQAESRPAGWYDVGSGWAAYWDGATWTGDRINHQQLAALTRPPAPPPPMVPPPPAARPAGAPGRGLAWWKWVGGFVVVATGFIALAALAPDTTETAARRPTLTTRDHFADAVATYNRAQGRTVEACCSGVLVVRIGENKREVSAATGEALAQLLVDLGFTSGVVARMEGTRALDGTQTADGLYATLSWTYHPDNGLRLVFEPN